MISETLRVDLGARSYDIRIGEGLVASAGVQIAPLLSRPMVVIVTDETCAIPMGRQATNPKGESITINPRVWQN